MTYSTTRPPTGGGTPADTVTALDGTASAGATTDYSRGDHKHADTARHSHANAAALALVSGTNTGDQDLSGKLDLHAKADTAGAADSAVTLAAGADRTKLDGIAASATVGADWNTNVANKPTLGTAAAKAIGDFDATGAAAAAQAASLPLHGKADSAGAADTAVTLATGADRTKLDGITGTNTGDQTLVGLGGVPTTRTVTINGTAQDLSADRSWTVTAALPDLLFTKNSATVDSVITAGYSFYIPDAFEIAVGINLEIGLNSVLEIG